MDIVLAGIAVAAFAATVFVLAAAASRSRRPGGLRTVLLPEDDDERWLTVRQLAVELELSEPEVVAVVERGDVPFYIVRGGDASDPAYVRFRRDEIDAWTIG